MNPDSDKTNHNSDEKTLSVENLNCETASINPDKQKYISLDPKATDDCLGNNFTRTLYSNQNGLNEEESLKKDDFSPRKADFSGESTIQDNDDDEMKSGKKHPKNGKKLAKRKPEYGNFCEQIQNEESKPKKLKFKNLDQDFKARPITPNIDYREAPRPGKMDVNPEEEFAAKGKTKEETDRIVYTDKKSETKSVDKVEDKPKQFFWPFNGSPSPKPAPPAVPKKDSKPEIFNNKWGFPVNNSKEFDDNPCLPYEDIREFITKNKSELLDWLQQLVDSDEKMLPMPFRPTLPEHKNDKFIRVAPDDVKGKNIYFVGDVHGDLLSFTTILNTLGINPYTDKDGSVPKDTVIVLLGDIFDRLPDCFEVFFTVLWCMYKYGNIVWISGNHDMIGYDESTDSFKRSTNPSEYADWLNDPNGANIDKMYTLARQITKLYSKLLDSLPSALYFPDGLLVSHGGVPHPNWYKFIQKWQDFSSSNFIHDFYWKRLHESKRHAAFCNSKGGELGIKDFYSFCCLLNDIFKSPVSAFLRGHDHFPERVKVFDAYKLPVVTFNSISCTQDRCDPIGKFGYQTMPVIIKYQPSIPKGFIPNDELDELVEKERIERERLEQVRLEKERLEQERLEKERLERELLEKERREKERLERERREKERQEKERLERERLENELASKTSDKDSGEDNSVSECSSKLKNSSDSDSTSSSCKDNCESADDKVEAKSDPEASDQSIPISVFEVNPSDDYGSKPETPAEPVTDSAAAGCCDTDESSDGKVETESELESAEKEDIPSADEGTNTDIPSKLETPVVSVPAAVSPEIKDEDPPTPKIPNLVINRLIISRKLLDQWYPEE